MLTKLWRGFRRRLIIWARRVTEAIRKFKKLGKNIVKREFSSLLLSFLLILGYLFLNKKSLSPLLQRVPRVPQNISLYKQEVWNQFYQYQAINIFDKGYAIERGPQFHKRLLASPEDVPLEKECFVVEDNSSEGTIKIVLPEGFRDGVLSSKIEAQSEYSIEVSSDLKSWQFYNYPGYSEPLKNTLSLEKKNLPHGVVYLKFVPKSNETLGVCFDEFQYTSALPSNVVDYSDHLLFPPDIEVDYDGEIIYQPAVRWQNH